MKAWKSAWRVRSDTSGRRKVGVLLEGKYGGEKVGGKCGGGTWGGNVGGLVAEEAMFADLNTGNGQGQEDQADPDRRG